MKKFIILLLALLSYLNVNAVETYERTEENLRVHESILVNSHNKYDILMTPSVDENLKVYDFANLLTDTEEINLYHKATKFISENNMDLVLVTIDDNWTDAMNYADNFYDYNYFGLGNTFDGLLVLIDMDTREMYISTTGETILMFNDYRIERILDDMYYYIKGANYYETFNAAINKISDFADDGIPSDNKSSYIDENGNYVYVEHKHFPLGLFLLISIGVATITLIIFINKNKLVKKAYEADKYIEDGKMIIKNLGDIFINSHTSSVRISSDSSGSSSRSGGSSSHRSSSGRSHGGGGRRF